MQNQQSPTIYINFIAGINDKTTSLLIYLLTEQLRAGVNSFRINISSGGGMILNAVSIYNFLHGLKDVSIHTHNLGQIDSAANLIFMAGKKRTASKASTFLLHPPQMNIPPNQGHIEFSIEKLEERLHSLKMDKQKMAEIIADKINKTANEISILFDKRQTYSSIEAKELGFIESLEEFVASPGLPIFSITNQS